jgi:tripartite-type tricarboxylate transporter receptor subunit TctC
VSVMIDPMPSSYPHVKSGKLKALAVTSRKRVSFLPDVPTVAESGLPGFEMVSWYGIWAPPGLSRELAARIAAEATKAVHSPLAEERLGGQGFDAVGSTPEEFGGYIQQEIARYAKIVKEAGIKVE